MVLILDRVKNAPKLLIKEIAAETNALISSGAPILNLSQGAPNLPIFETARSAVIEVLESRQLPYTEVAGEKRVRQTCANFLNRIVLDGERDLFNASHICVTNGAVGAVYTSLAIQISCPKDIVVSPLPCYGLYNSDTNLLGGTFVSLEVGTPDDGFALTPTNIRDAFKKYGEKLRCLILCCPNNPTGRCLSDAEAKLLAKELDEQLKVFPDFSLLLDEVYTGIGSSHNSILKYASQKLQKSCLITVSASKGLGGAPGARAGFVAAADESLVSQLVKIQMAIGANVSIPSQRILSASLEHVLSNPDVVLGSVSKFYQERTDFVCSRLERMGEKYVGERYAFCPRKSDGTFYVLARFECLGGTDLEVQRLLRDAYQEGDADYGVAVVPLSAFDMDEKMCMVRICCAVDIDILDKALETVEAVISRSLSVKI
eukprot:CAMPEP_0195308742 /NCGR_PEP_ID=MMETSP0707-20130614/38382_1 /TAXON_ID=33640 /ORGANISM="Asterionellopsis glacialis, Strain CCMP134" /LENGTH=429 /DNA_ID=CAMNT_0040373025 /DNA_START=116 /DNA_END=1405 /DNA_ORIENTATION=-